MATPPTPAGGGGEEGLDLDEGLMDLDLYVESSLQVLPNQQEQEPQQQQQQQNPTFHYDHNRNNNNAEPSGMAGELEVPASFWLRPVMEASYSLADNTR